MAEKKGANAVGFACLNLDCVASSVVHYCCCASTRKPVQIRKGTDLPLQSKRRRRLGLEHHSAGSTGIQQKAYANGWRYRRCRPAEALACTGIHRGRQTVWCAVCCCLCLVQCNTTHKACRRQSCVLGKNIPAPSREMPVYAAHGVMRPVFEILPLKEWALF